MGGGGPEFSKIFEIRFFLAYNTFIMTQHRKNPLKYRVLVLNKLFMPIRVVSARKAVIHLYKNKAEVITVADEDYYNYSFDRWVEVSNNGGIPTLDSEDYIHTPSYRIAVPRIIRLKKYEGFQEGKVNFTRRNVFTRDNYTCQYCGERKPRSELSIDHVTPRSKKGKTTWTNVVTACQDCNVAKGGRLLENTSMDLQKVPRPPSINPVVRKHARKEKYQVWQEFLEDTASIIKMS